MRERASEEEGRERVRRKGGRGRVREEVREREKWRGKECMHNLGKKRYKATGSSTEDIQMENGRHGMQSVKRENA